jgi:hypothetical protein
LKAKQQKKICKPRGDGIFYQFVDANGDNESIYIIELKKDISLMEYKIKRVECIVAILREVAFSETLLKELQSFGIRTNGIDPDKEDYELRLRKILASIAPRKFQLQEMVNELDAYEKSMEDKKIDRNFFTTMLMRLSKFMRYHIRAHDIMTSEYIALFKEYVSHSSKQKIETDGEEG